MNAKHTLPPQYQALSDGRVISLTGWRGARNRVLLPVDHGGYAAIRVTINGKRERRMVHQIICATFHGPAPSPQHEVRHLNGDCGDNRACNLAWGTKADNAADRERHGRTSRGEAHSRAIRASHHAEGVRAFRARQRYAKATGAA